MSRVRKNYPAAFKAKIALNAVQGDQTTAELSSQYRVHSTVINQRKRHLLPSTEDCFSNKNAKRQEGHSEIVKELHAKIGQLQCIYIAAGTYLDTVYL